MRRDPPSSRERSGAVRTALHCGEYRGHPVSAARATIGQSLTEQRRGPKTASFYVWSLIVAPAVGWGVFFLTVDSDGALLPALLELFGPAAVIFAVGIAVFRPAAHDVAFGLVLCVLLTAVAIVVALAILDRHGVFDTTRSTVLIEPPLHDMIVTKT